MSKEKQIEEMVGVMRKTPPKEMMLNGRKQGRLMWSLMVLAEHLYNAGYRKQSEGENITKMHPVHEFICSKCGAIFRDCALIVIDEEAEDERHLEFEFGYCPRCGMKVKG